MFEPEQPRSRALTDGLAGAAALALAALVGILLTALDFGR